MARKILHKNKTSTRREAAIRNYYKGLRNSSGTVESAATQLCRRYEGLSQKPTPKRSNGYSRVVNEAFAVVKALESRNPLPTVSSPRNTEAKEFLRVREAIRSATADAIDNLPTILEDEPEEVVDSFDDSDERIKEISEHVVSGIARNNVSSETRKPPTLREVKFLHEPGDKYARSKGAWVEPVDRDGFPDRLYWFKKTPLGHVEYKYGNNKPDPHQAVKIQELRNTFGYDMARVFNNLNDFESWIDRRIKEVLDNVSQN
jgi:hypothetical protein